MWMKLALLDSSTAALCGTVCNGITCRHFNPFGSKQSAAFHTASYITHLLKYVGSQFITR
jgi:hypothetical protein